MNLGGEFEPEVLKFCPFSCASCMHRKYFTLAANTVFSDFEGNGHNLVITWLKETGMEKLIIVLHLKVCTTEL